MRRLELAAAYVLLAGALTGWPLSMIWWAKDEPPFVLSLSWLALVLTAWDIVKTSRVHREQGKGEDSGSR